MSYQQQVMLAAHEIVGDYKKFGGSITFTGALKRAHRVTKIRREGAELRRTLGEEGFKAHMNELKAKARIAREAKKA